jgi:hypothetical protein
VSKTRTAWTEFKVALASIRQNDGLSPADRRLLAQWTEDDLLWRRHWQKIQTKMQQRIGWWHAEFIRFFIREVLATKRLADSTELRHSLRPIYIKYAKQAEGLARFLKEPARSRLPPAVPFGGKLASQLEEAARLLRRRANPDPSGPLRVSRVSRKGSRPRVAFMRLMSNLLNEMCGRPMDEAVVVLTNIAFPNHYSTRHEVRAARLPSTRKQAVASRAFDHSESHRVRHGFFRTHDRLNLSENLFHDGDKCPNED